MLRLIGTYQDSAGKEQSFRVEVDSKPEPLAKKGKAQVIKPQEKAEIESLVNSALEEYCQTKGQAAIPFGKISKLEVTEDHHKVHLFVGSKLVETLDVAETATAMKSTHHPQVKLKEPLSFSAKGSLKRTPFSSPFHKLIHFFSWSANLLFGPSGAEQFKKQKLFTLLLNHTYTAKTPDIFELKQSERLKAFREIVAQEGRGFGAAEKQIKTSLEACEKFSQAWEKLTPHYESVKAALMRIKDDSRHSNKSNQKKLEKELQNIKKSGQDQLAKEWKSVASLKNEDAILLPLFFEDQLSNSLMRISRKNDSYTLQIINADPHNSLSHSLATDRHIKQERAITFENLSLDELKTQFEIQQNLFPSLEELEGKKEPKADEAWQKGLLEGPLAAKRKAASPLPEDYITLSKNNTLAKPLTAFLGIFDSGPELKRLKLRLRLAAISRFYDTVKFNLKDNETNYILLKDGMQKISRTISKLLNDNVLSADEVKQIAPVMQKLEKKLAEIEKERNARWQMDLRGKSPMAFPQVTLTADSKLYALPKELQAQTIQDVAALKSSWLEPPSLEGLKSPAGVSQTLAQSLEHAKGLYEQKDYAKLSSHVLKVYLNLEIPQNPDDKNDFWSKVDPAERAACSEALNKLQVYLFESIVKQRMPRPFPPEIPLAYGSLYAVFDRLARLEDPTYQDYRFTSSLDFSWGHLTHIEDRNRADRIGNYYTVIKDKISLQFYSRIGLISLGLVEKGEPQTKKSLGDYLEERKQWLETKGKSISISSEVSKLKSPMYYSGPLSQPEIHARRMRAEIESDLGEKNLLPKAVVHFREASLLFGHMLFLSLNNYQYQEELASYHWDGTRPYLKQKNDSSLKEIDSLAFRLTGADKAIDNGEQDYSSFTPIREPLLKKGLSDGGYSSESTLSQHVKGETYDKRPTRLADIPEEASRDRLLINVTNWTKLSETLGYYWENRNLLADPQHQEDLRRLVFGRLFKLSNVQDQLSELKGEGCSTEFLAIKEELKNPYFMPYLQEFFDHHISLFENEQNFAAAANLAYLASHIKSHIASWDPHTPNLNKDYESYLRGLLDKVPENALDDRRQVYGYLTCLLLHSKNLSEPQERDLCKSWLIHSIIESDPKGYHPLREHQVERTISSWMPKLRERLKSDIPFRNQALSEVISECYHAKVDSKEWSGEFPLLSNGEFQVELEKGIIFKNGKATAFIPAAIKLNPAFRRCFAENFSPLAEIVMVPPEKGNSQGFLCYQFSADGKQYRALTPTQGELVLQREETIDGNTAWYQYTHRDPQKIEDSFSQIAQDAFKSSGEKPGVKTVIRTLLQSLKKRLDLFIPKALVEKTWWVNTQDRSQILALDNKREPAFVLKLASEKKTQTAEAVRDIRSSSPSKDLQLLNVWKNKLPEWNIFRQFSHPQNILVWGKNNVPAVVEFTEHNLEFHYDEKTKQWNCGKAGLEGYHLSTSKDLPALGNLRNALILENSLGEKKVLLAARPVLPGDLEEYIPNSFGNLLKKVWNHLFGTPNGNFLKAPLSFNRSSPSTLFVLATDQLGTQLNPDPAHRKQGATPHLYLAELYLRTNQFSRAMEQLSKCVNKNGFSPEEKAAFESLGSFAEKQATSDARFSAFLLHLDKVNKESQPNNPVSSGSVVQHYENYLKEVGKERLGNIPEALLLSSADEKNIWRDCEGRVPEKIDKNKDNPLYKVLQNRKDLLWTDSTPAIDSLANKKVKVLSPKSNAAAAKVHEVMRKTTLSTQELALKEVAQKLSSFHKVRQENIQKKSDFSELRTWLRSLPEDDYVETLRSYLEAAMDLNNAEELPKEFQALAALDLPSASIEEIQKLLEACADASQRLFEQHPECCQAHLISADADLAAKSIASGHITKPAVGTGKLEIKATPTLFSPEEIDRSFETKDADSVEERKSIGAEFKSILERVADNNPNHTNISKRVCKDLLEDYDSFLNTYDYKTYTWKKDSKTELASIENALASKQEVLLAQSQKFDQAIDEILNKKELIPGADLEQEFKKLGMGSKALSKQRLRHLFLQKKMDDLTQFNANLTSSDLERLNQLLTQYFIAETGLQQVNRAQSIMSEMKKSDSNREELLPIFVETLKAQRVYDPWKHPEFLIMEYEANILFREKQVSVIHEMVHDPDCIKQLIMGAGKTTVILPLVALLRADGEHLSIVISTQALYGTMKDQLLRQSKNLLNQDGFAFEWERYPLAESLKKANGLYSRLLGAIENRQYILSTRESFQCLEASYTELLNAKATATGSKKEEIEQALSELKKVRKLLKDKGRVTADEVDHLMNPKEKTIFPTGPAQKFNPEELAITIEVYTQLLKSPKVGLHENNQGNLTEKEQEVERRAVATHFVSSEQGLALIATDAIQKNFIQAHQNDFIEYLLCKKGETDFPLIADFLAKYPDKDNAIQTLRGLLSEILSTTLAGTYSKDYIRSKDMETTTPTEEKDVPKEGSQFGHRLENLCFILQDYLHMGVAPEKLQSILKFWHQNALAQADKEKVPYGETAAAQTFAHIFGKSLQDLKKNNQGEPRLADCEALSKILKNDEQKLFSFLKEHLLNKPSLYGELIEQNSQQFVSMFSSFGGFSGTLNPYIFHRCNQKTIDRARDAGTDTRTLFLLLRNNRRLIKEGNPNGLVLSFKPQDASEQITALNTEERVQHFLNQLKDFDLIGDAGGIVQGCSDEKVVDLLPQVKAKAYYNAEGVPVVKTADGKIVPLRESDVARHDRATWLAARYARGADVPQHYYANGVFSIAEKMSLDDLLQTVWRLRGLGQHQLAYLLVAGWQEKHFSKNEQGAVGFEGILINAVKEKGISEAENDLRKAKDELEDIVRDDIRNKMLSASPEDEEKLLTKYRQFFVTKIGNSSKDEFKRADEKEDPLVQLQRQRDDLLALCKANPDDLSTAHATLQRKEYDFASKESKEHFKAFFADEVRKESSATAKTQVRVQTEAEQQVQQKLAVRQFAEEPRTHPYTKYPHLAAVFERIFSPKPYVAENLDEIEDALAGKGKLEDYFHFNVAGTSNYTPITPDQFVRSAHDFIHPAFPPNLKFTENWLPIFADRWSQENSVDLSPNVPVIKHKKNPDGSDVVAKPLQAFDHPLQQPVHFVKVMYDPRNNTWEVEFLSKEDQEGRKQLIDEDLEMQKRKNGPNSQVQMGLYDLRTDKVTDANIVGLDAKIKGAPEVFECLVKAKVLAGQVHFSQQEKEIIDKWLKKYYEDNGPAALDEFVDFIRSKVLPYTPTHAQVAEQSYFFKTAKNLLQAKA